MISTKNNKLKFEFGKLEFYNKQDVKTEGFFVVNIQNKYINSKFDICKLNNQLIFGANQVKKEE
ncbi:MAG: hypothetical protein WCS51_03325 [Bacilli bacterium]